MSSALIAILIVVAVLAGTILTLRTSAKTGLPPPEVLERATKRARELEAQEKAKQDGND